MFRDRRDLAGFPLPARLIHLEDAIAGADIVLPVRRLAANGADGAAQIVGNGYGGLIAKDDASVYEGGATRRWLKVKQKDWTVEEDGWRRRITVAQPGGS
jgi:ATP-dependent DNA ligase